MYKHKNMFKFCIVILLIFSSVNIHFYRFADSSNNLDSDEWHERVFEIFYERFYHTDIDIRTIERKILRSTQRQLFAVSAFSEIRLIESGIKDFELKFDLDDKELFDISTQELNQVVNDIKNNYKKMKSRNYEDLKKVIAKQFELKILEVEPEIEDMLTVILEQSIWDVEDMISNNSGGHIDDGIRVAFAEMKQDDSNVFEGKDESQLREYYEDKLKEPSINFLRTQLRHKLKESVYEILKNELINMYRPLVRSIVNDYEMNFENYIFNLIPRSYTRVYPTNEIMSITQNLNIELEDDFENIAEGVFETINYKKQVEEYSRKILNSPRVWVNDVMIEMDVSPMIINGRTMVPIRAITENLGASVDWNDALKAVTILLGNDEIKLFIDNTKVVVNGINTNIDVPPTIVNSRTLVPVRFISEKIGKEVGWIDPWKLVKIN